MFNFTNFFKFRHTEASATKDFDFNIVKRMEMYRSEYYFQLELKEKLFSRLTIYSAFIMACITSNIAIVETLIKLDGWRLTFVVFFWEISVTLLICILYGLVCFTLIKVDNWVNSNTDMENYRITLRNHFQKHVHGTDSEEDYVNEQFLIYLTTQYAHCSTIVRTNNIYRQQWIARIVFLTYCLVICTFLNGLIYIIEKI